MECQTAYIDQLKLYRRALGQNLGASEKMGNFCFRK